MPVIDHPIHPSTQKGKDFRYGCWNREPFTSGYFAPDRQMEETLEFSLQAKYVPHNMSTDCKYDLSHRDNNCKGCKHGNNQ